MSSAASRSSDSPPPASSSLKTLTVWDSIGDPPASSGIVYRWNGYSQAGSSLSLLRYIDENGEELRRKYVEWIRDLGEYRVGERTLVDCLAIDNVGGSYWWMTLFVEQSPWKSPAIMNSIRLLALEQIINAERPGVVQFVSANRAASEVLGALCRTIGTAYEWTAVHGARASQGLYHRLPHVARALIFLARRMVLRWRLRAAKTSSWFEGENAVFFASYFIHLDQAAAKRGVFHSKHWEELPNLLREHGVESNWIQHFLPNGVVPDTAAGVALAQRFSSRPHEEGFHTFVDAYLSWRVVGRAFRIWLNICRVAPSSADVRAAFTPKDSRLSLWPVARDDWNNSVRGAVAMENSLWLSLFDEAMAGVPRQNTGLFLYENQSWERAFIHAWRIHQHGQLIGVSHSTVRFWDLRYFVAPRSADRSSTHLMPAPDAVALNGAAAASAFVSTGYSKTPVVETEALRYGYLYGRKTERAARTVGSGLKVLILTDYHSVGTVSMLRMLEAASQAIKREVSFTVKPHPNYNVDVGHYPGVDLSVNTAPLETVLQDFDVAFASNNTSAAVDAYLAGLTVLVALDETELNFSPLRGRRDVRFVSDARELADALEKAEPRTVQTETREDFFFLDPTLPKWRRLLSLDMRQRASAPFETARDDE